MSEHLDLTANERNNPLLVAAIQAVVFDAMPYMAELIEGLMEEQREARPSPGAVPSWAKQ